MTYGLERHVNWNFIWAAITDVGLVLNAVLLAKAAEIVSPHISPGFGILGQSIDTGWVIVCRTIAMAMVQGGSLRMSYRVKISK